MTPVVWRAARESGHTLPLLPRDRWPLGEFSLDLIPLSRLRGVAPRIPAGTLLFVVRSEQPGMPYRVSHAGLVVEGPRGKRLVRHASDVAGTMRVRDEPLPKFVARNERYRIWRVSGVSLFSIRNDADRVRQLEASAAPPDPRR